MVKRKAIGKAESIVEEQYDEMSSQTSDDEAASAADDYNNDGDDSDGDNEDDDKVEFEHVAEKASGMANTINRLLSKKIEQSDTKRPILSKLKSIERRIDSDKLEHRAKKILRGEKVVKIDRERIIAPGVGDAACVEYEKRLRKVSTRGVVTLFNAIRSAQKEHAGDDAGSVIDKNQFLGMIEKKTVLSNGAAATTKINDDKVTPAWIKDDFAVKSVGAAAAAWDEEEDE